MSRPLIGLWCTTRSQTDIGFETFLDPPSLTGSISAFSFTTPGSVGKEGRCTLSPQSETKVFPESRKPTIVRERGPTSVTPRHFPEPETTLKGSERFSPITSTPSGLRRGFPTMKRKVTDGRFVVPQHQVGPETPVCRDLDSESRW